MFEFDPVKSAANKAKHGIDFVEAQALWNDDKLAVIAARMSGEARFAAIGRIGDLMWTAIATMRGDNIRFISVRRARKDEVTIYDGQEDNRS
ncbi:MAG: BrnT family toxin [Phyllobacteriaceae bacterium]|nr:BrnT family toxin [Phyllobacteriaceae bacterium]